MTVPRQVKADDTSPRLLWFPRLKENRGADIYLPKRPTLRRVQKPKGQKNDIHDKRR